MRKYIPLSQRSKTSSFQSGDTAIEDIKRGLAYVETRDDPNAYNALGKPNSKGERAYGKYQFFSPYIGGWTKQYLGQEMTPDQLLADPEAQENLMTARAKELYGKYGNAEDVASVHFTGRPVAQANNAADYTGTSNSSYQELFKQGVSREKGSGQVRKYTPLAQRRSTMSV